MKIQKFLKIVLVIAILIILYLIIRSTYSKYVTGTDDMVNAHISKWHILLNNEDIMTNANFTEDIFLDFEENANINERVIAPTSKGSFYIELESTGTEVPFEYDIKVAKQSFSTSFSSNNPDDYITSDGTNTTYEFTLDFDYPGTGYVWQDDGEGNYDFKCPPIEFTVPSGFLLDQSNIDWLDTTKNITQTGNKVKLYAKRTAWGANPVDSTKSSNHFRNTLKLTFDHELDLTTTTLISALKADDIELSPIKSNLPDFRITKYTLVETRETDDVNYLPPSTLEEITVPREQTSIIGTVLPAKNTTDDFISTRVINTFYFELEWYDGEDNILNNHDDVAVAKGSFPIGVIPIKVTVTQVED